MTPPPGTVLATATLSVDLPHLQAVAAAIGTATGERTATLVPFFGPTVAGERALLDALALDVSRSTLGEQRYRWRRPFRAGEAVDVVVTLDGVSERGLNRLYVVRSDLSDAAGSVVQTQATTFVERTG